MPKETDPEKQPWTIGYVMAGDVFNPACIFTGDIAIALVYGIPIHVKLGDIESDARSQEGLRRAALISASEELREALKMFMDIWGSKDSSSTSKRAQQRRAELWEKANAAIAKSEWPQRVTNAER